MNRRAFMTCGVKDCFASFRYLCCPDFKRTCDTCAREPIPEAFGPEHRKHLKETAKAVLEILTGPEKVKTYAIPAPLLCKLWNASYSSWREVEEMKDKETDPKTEAVDQRACSVRCPACGVLLNPDVNVPELVAEKCKALRMFWKLDKAYIQLHTRHQRIRKMNAAMFMCSILQCACIVALAASIVIMWGKAGTTEG